MSDDVRCPVCGEANRCAQAESAAAGHSCWCHSVNIPKALLDTLPENQRGQACICSSCIREFKEKNPSTENKPPSREL